MLGVGTCWTRRTDRLHGRLFSTAWADEEAPTRRADFCDRIFAHLSRDLGARLPATLKRHAQEARTIGRTEPWHDHIILMTDIPTETWL